MSSQEILDKGYELLAEAAKAKGYSNRLKEELDELKNKGQLTLRDQFAMAALHIPFSRSGAFQEDRFNIMAEMAYKVSDAMLAEREK